MHETGELRSSVQLGLAAEILAAGGTIRLRALGSSMLPTLWPGDLLTIDGASCPAAVPGDLVLVLVNQRALVHRVRERLERDGLVRWVTRGDAVPQNDPPVWPSELLGRVSAVQRDRRVIVPRRRISYAAQLLAWMLCYGDSFRNVCLRLHSLRHSPRQLEHAENMGG